MRSEAHYLWDIVEAIDAVERFIGTKTFEQFSTDEILRSAVHAKLIIVGEAVSNLSDKLIAKYVDIPWAKIRGFRNAVVHGYFKVSWEIMWGAATSNARDLRRGELEILKAEYPQFTPEIT